MTTSPIIERAKKLLALAQSATGNERDVALAKANSLIAEHKIDMVLLDAALQDKPEEFAEEKIEGAVGTYRSRMPVEIKFIGWLLKNHFNVEIVYSTRRCPERNVVVKYFNMFGRKSDAEFARWLTGYLQEEFLRRWDYFRKSHGAGRGDRNTFLYGLYEGLDEKLDEEKAALEARKFSEVAADELDHESQDADDARAASISGTDHVSDLKHPARSEEQLKDKYALAVVDEEKAREIAHKTLYPRLTSSRSSRMSLNSGGARSAGRDAGRMISTRRPLN